MSKRVMVRTLAVLSMIVGIAAPLTSHAQQTPETEIACDGGDSLQTALATVQPGGRIIIRSGICTGNFVLSRDVRIQGSSYERVTLKATEAEAPVVTVPRGVSATIGGVTISGGRVGLRVAGRVALAYSTVRENTTAGIEVRDNGSLDGDKVRVTLNKGPGITVQRAEVALRGSLVARNIASGPGGGGLQVASGRVELISTQIEDNEAVRDGGGVLATLNSTLVLDNVRLFRNTARTGHGGAIAVHGSTVEALGSSLFENFADVGNGGGIAVMSKSETRLTNTTVAYNIASSQAESPGGWGGGLFVDKSSRALLVHTTIAVNSARFAAGIASDNTVSMLASLMSGNLSASKDDECGGNGRIESKGWNLVMGLGDCRFVSRPGDLIGASPRLGPPGQYGGRWNTVPLQDGSPALDRIPLQACAGTLDQRRKPRPARGGCDVGAFERQADDMP